VEDILDYKYILEYNAVVSKLCIESCTCP